MIRVEGVSKSVPAWDRQPSSHRDRLYRRVPALMRLGPQRETLTDISFEVPSGGALGLIGGNGAGKSTLLKILAGLIRPNSGSIEITGTVRSVLALGEAFDQSLSGADNAMTTAMIGGMSAKNARAALPRVLEFADLERFGIAPVRTYSEGMKLRLAMGVLAQLDGDVYLVDEVLAVGDAWFQARCLEFFRERRLQGATMVIASHDLDRLAGQVERILWLDGGRPRLLSEPKSVLREYRQRLTVDSVVLTPESMLQTADGGEPVRIGTGEVRIEDLRVTVPGETASPGAPLAVSLRLRTHGVGPRVCHVAVSIFTADGTKAFDVTTASSEQSPTVTDAGVEVRLRVEQLPLASGEYRVEVGAYREDWKFGYDIRPRAGLLHLAGRLGDEGVAWAPSEWGFTHEA